jgi:hypothetical protein
VAKVEVALEVVVVVMALGVPVEVVAIRAVAVVRRAANHTQQRE